jgi:hypothetical protein
MLSKAFDYLGVILELQHNNWSELLWALKNMELLLAFILN